MKLRRAMLFGLLVGSGLMLAATISRWRSRHSNLALQTDLPSERLASEVVSPKVFRVGPDLRSEPVTAVVATESLPDPFLGKLGYALESLQRKTDSSNRDQELDALVGEIAQTNLLVALEFLKSRNAFGPARDLNLRLVRRWAELDARAAADWVTENLMGTVREESINGVAIVWANQDLPGAIAWVKQLPADDRETGLRTVAYEAASAQPVAAINLAAELSPGESQEEVVLHAVRQWAGQDPKSAADWGKKITEEGLRDKVLAAVATEWGESDPAAAATLAVKSVAPGKPQEDAVVGIAQRWVQKQPAEAAAWVTAFPEGPLRDTTMEAVVKLWADQDLQQPAKWLATLEAGPGRDSAIGAYVGKLALSFPAVALQWAEEIAQETSRDQQMETVAENWMAVDAVAARSWIAQAPLPEESKARLLAERKP